MPLALGTLGWIAGSVLIIAVYMVSLLAARLLTSVFEVDGVRLPRYYTAVGHILGHGAQRVAAGIQLTDLFLVNIAFTITAGTSMQSIANITCNIPPEEWGKDVKGDGCLNSKWMFMLIFGGAELIIVQVGNLEHAGWLSLLGVASSCSYSAIAFGLCIAKVAQGNHFGTVGGITYPSSAGKAFAVLNALGTVTFAFAVSGVLLEIQGTLREPPQAKLTMHKATAFGYTFGCLIYTSVSVLGYLALGDGTPGNLLTAFDSPKWLLIVTNLLVVFQMVASYNVVAQTFLLTGEEYAEKLFHVQAPQELQAGTLDPEEDPEGAAAAKVAGREEETGSIKAATAGGDVPASFPAASTSSGLGVVRRRVQGHGGDSTAWRGEQHYGRRRPLHHYHKVIQRVRHAPTWVLSCLSGSSGGTKGAHPRESGAQAPGCAAKEGGRGGGLRFMVVYTGVKLAYVAAATILALVMPFFSEILGLIGGLIFWPLTIYFPFTMYIKVHHPSGGRLLFLRAVMGVMLLLAAGATIGSFRNILTTWTSSFCITC